MGGAFFRPFFFTYRTLFHFLFPVEEGLQGIWSHVSLKQRLRLFPGGAGVSPVKSGVPPDFVVRVVYGWTEDRQEISTHTTVSGVTPETTGRRPVPPGQRRNASAPQIAAANQINNTVFTGVFTCRCDLVKNFRITFRCLTVMRRDSLLKNHGREILASPLA